MRLFGGAREGGFPMNALTIMFGFFSIANTKGYWQHAFTYTFHNESRNNMATLSLYLLFCILFSLAQITFSFHCRWYCKRRSVSKVSLLIHLTNTFEVLMATFEPNSFSHEIKVRTFLLCPTGAKISPYLITRTQRHIH